MCRVSMQYRRAYLRYLSGMSPNAARPITVQLATARARGLWKNPLDNRDDPYSQDDRDPGLGEEVLRIRDHGQRDAFDEDVNEEIGGCHEPPSDDTHDHLNHAASASREPGDDAFQSMG